MLPTPAPSVKPTCRQLVQQHALIWVPLGGAALILWLTGWDISLARLLYQPQDHSAFHIATHLRHYGTLPGTLFTAAAIGILLWPKLWNKRPLLYRTALVVTLTAVFGVGLVNQVVVKKLADRTRPHESILLDPSIPTTDTFRGNSMPSGHAAMGFVIAAPFFPLRRRRPRLAKAFLATGIAAGTILGLSRMVLGAHFATDVLIAAAITFSSAMLFNMLAERVTCIPTRSIALGIVIFVLCLIFGNRFTHQYLTLEIPGPIAAINLPCQVVSVPADVTVPTLSVSLNGYGTPPSLLELQNKNNVISLKRNLGIYHHLTCTAQLAVPHAD